MKPYDYIVGNIGSPSQEHLLSQIVKKSQSILLHSTSVFPFDLFPDHIIIDENKVSIIHKDFWGIEHIHSILIEDITGVAVDTGPLLATFKITDSNNPRFPLRLKVNNLKKSKARQIRNLIQGLMATKRQGVDLCFDKQCSTKLSQEIEKVGATMGPN